MRTLRDSCSAFADSHENPSVFARAALAGLQGYRWILAPLFMSLGVQCRFQPTCSEYARQALEKHGFFKGIFLSLWRLGRCHPLCRGGHDPVPGIRIRH